MKLWNHYDLEKLSQNPKLFISFLENFIKSHGIEDTLDLIRVSGICFNIYKGRQTVHFQKVISIIKEHYKNNTNQIEDFMETIKSFELMFNDFSDLKTLRKLDQIPKKREIITFILSLEIMLGSILEYIHGHSLIRIKQVYPYVFSLFDDEKRKVVMAKKDFNRVLGISDNISEFSGSLLKSFGGIDGSLGKLETMRMEHVRVAREHIELFDIWSTIVNLEQKWRFIGGNLVSDRNNIHMEIKDDNFLKATEISKLRFNNQKHKWFADFNLSDKSELKMRINPNTVVLPPKQYICEDEAFFCIAIGEFLHTYDLDIKCLNVSLAEWIRAYMIISEEAKKHLKERFESNVVKPLNLGNWTIIKKADEWTNMLISKGISSLNAVTIVENFLFKKDSKDLLDCPFIVHNDYLIVIPSVASHIDPSMSLISLFTKKNVDISFKGTGFEDEILSKLKKQGISAKRLKHIQDGETYECDAVFTLNDDLFFLELKAFGQPLNVKEYYNFLLKIQGGTKKINQNTTERSATEQLNRIVDFYESNLNFVIEELQLTKTWNLKSIHKIIVTTGMIGESMFYNNCFIIDSSILIRFLDRMPPGISIGKTFLRPHHKDFEGEITSEKLINILKNPPQIELGNLRVSKNYRNFTMKDKTIDYLYYKDKLGDLIKLDKEHYNKLLDKFGLTMDEIASTIE